MKSQEGSQMGLLNEEKKKKSGVGGLFAVVTVIILVLALSYVGAASFIGPGKGDCEEVIAKFQSSINNVDIMEFIDVVAPGIKSMLPPRLIMPVGEDPDLSSEFYEMLNSIATGLLPADPNGSEKEILEKLEIKPVSYGLPGKIRKVKCEVRYWNGTYRLIRFTIQKHEGKCIIKSLTFIDK